MSRLFYWVGKENDTTNINNVRTSAVFGSEKFASSGNIWNKASNWAEETGEATGDWEGSTGGDPRFFETSSRYPVAGDRVRFEKIVCSLDGSTTDVTFPFCECLLGGTTLDYKWGGGTNEAGITTAAGPLLSLEVLNTYSTHLIENSRYQTGTGTYGGRLGVDFNTSHDSYHQLTGIGSGYAPKDGLGLYVDNWVDYSWKEWTANPTSSWYARRAKTHTFSAGLNVADMCVKGGAHYMIPAYSYSTTVYGNTFGNIELDRRGVTWGSLEMPNQTSRFEMAGRTQHYTITGSLKDTSIYFDADVAGSGTHETPVRPTRNTFTSRTAIPTVIMGCINRQATSETGEDTNWQHDIIFMGDITNLRVYPDKVEHNNTEAEQSGNWPNQYERYKTPPGSIILEGASGGAGGASEGIEITNLYIEDTNPFHGGITNGPLGSNVIIKLGNDSPGATITNLYQYSGWLRPMLPYGATSNPEIAKDRIIIQNGEINSNCVLQGFDYATEAWNNFEIQGHTLGTEGNKNGLLQVDNNCDIRLAQGARVSTTTRTADVAATKLSTAAFIRKQP